jgi:hypothetical protein
MDSNVSPEGNGSNFYQAFTKTINLSDQSAKFSFFILYKNLRAGVSDTDIY